MKSRRTLAASFIVTMAVAPACKKETVVNPCNPPGPGCPGFDQGPKPNPSANPSATSSATAAPTATGTAEVEAPKVSFAKSFLPVTRDEKGQCWQKQRPAFECPKPDSPGDPPPKCNPPPPQRMQVICPPDPPPGSTVVRRANGTCWAMVKANCPKSTPERRVTCNPPPPRRVLCPAKK